MKLSFAEVFETATFYAHFDVVKEGERDIPPLTIRVCDSLTCAMLGGEKLLHDLQSSAGPGIRVVRAPCVGRCDTAPAAEVGHHFRRSCRVSPACWPPPRAATPTRICPTMSATTPMSPAAAMSCSKRLRSGDLAEGGSAEGARRCVACAALAARAFRRGANGARCWASLVRG